MKPRSRLAAFFAGSVLALVLSATAFGYAGQVAALVTIGGPSGPVPCGTAVTLSAAVTDAAGAPIEGQPVDWAFSSSPSSKDKINATPTLTNANGVATTTVTLACVAGQRTITATADAARAGAVLSVSAAGLPRTSTALAGVPSAIHRLRRGWPSWRCWSAAG